jgi:hypothetical protein
VLRLLLEIGLSLQQRDILQVHLRKRRGPPMASPLQLQALSPALACLLAAAQAQKTDANATTEVTRRGDEHALDCAAACA